MSVMSFALGLHYLNSSNGAAMALLTKAVTRNAQGEANTETQAPAARFFNDPSVAGDANADRGEPAGIERQKPVRLFYFAM